jgi:uncharacterized FAD-dependent dehydrogenase
MPDYRIRQLALPLEAAGPGELRLRAARILGVPASAVERLDIEKRSVDARDKRRLRIVYGVLVGLGGPPRSLDPRAEPAPVLPPYEFPALPRAAGSGGSRPVVVGAGPAGLFAALMLAEAGREPLLLERGDDVEGRERAVASFRSGGALDPESNVQFGEGGAGTYSDGKLATQVRDERGRNRKVIAELLEAGAPPDVGVLAKPHVGTDYLVRVVANLRRKIISLGGEVRFRSRVGGLRIEGGRLVGLEVEGLGSLEACAVVFAPGNAARDSFAFLRDAGVPLERKPFAVGLRIEHPQEMISRAQYGEAWPHPELPPADYRLAGRAPDGRGVYSFCMCPGGMVVNASSEEGGAVSNGMSDWARDGRNANAAIVVQVDCSDFGGEGVLAGVDFQRRWERLAWESGGRGGALPVQTLADFLEGRRSAALGGIQPAVAGPWSLGELRGCLPPFAASGIAAGLGAFGRSIRGFDRPDAVLSGVETRTSSPVRILRGENLESALGGLFPAGEGAGYAGGIMSAAMDGIRAAEALVAAGY